MLLLNPINPPTIAGIIHPSPTSYRGRISWKKLLMDEKRIPARFNPSNKLMINVKSKLPWYTSAFPLNKEWKNVKKINTMANG